MEDIKMIISSEILKENQERQLKKDYLKKLQKRKLEKRCFLAWALGLGVLVVILSTIYINVGNDAYNNCVNTGINKNVCIDLIK
jgi:hypothetical protein